MKKEHDYYTWNKGESEFLGKHFNTKEFTCQCKLKSCVEQKVSVKLIDDLDRMRDACGKAIKINSGYRCPEHNKDIGGKENSSHCDGLAADITSPSLRADELVKQVDAIFDNVGVNAKQNWCHVDVRPLKADGSKRRWYY